MMWATRSQPPLARTASGRSRPPGKIKGVDQACLRGCIPCGFPKAMFDKHGLGIARQVRLETASPVVWACGPVCMEKECGLGTRSWFPREEEWTSNGAAGHTSINLSGDMPNSCRACLVKSWFAVSTWILMLVSLLSSGSISINLGRFSAIRWKYAVPKTCDIV